MFLIFIIMLGIALITYIMLTVRKCFYEERKIMAQEDCEKTLTTKKLNMQRFFVVNLIFQMMMVLLSLLYSFVIATGWDQLLFIAMLMLSAPIILIDIIGIICCYIKHKIKKNPRGRLEATKETSENKSSMSRIFQGLLAIAIAAYTLFIFVLFFLEILGFQ